jgi:hypothetical protein
MTLVATYMNGQERQDKIMKSLSLCSLEQESLLRSLKEFMDPHHHINISGTTAACGIFR